MFEWGGVKIVEGWLVHITSGKSTQSHLEHMSSNQNLGYLVYIGDLKILKPSYI